MSPLRTIACVVTVLSSLPAVAAEQRSAADTTYEKDRAACLAGQTGQSQADCLREAGAARDEARRQGLSTEPAAARIANAKRRCAVHAAADIRAACERLALGEGNQSGSVAGGGVVKSITLPASAASAASGSASAP